MRIQRSLFAGVLIALVAGCGGTKLNPVSGKVTHKGAACAGALVVFHPKGDDSITARRPNGVVGEDGSFTLTTDPTKPGDGAPAGEYVVAITWPAVERKPDLAKGMGGGGESKAQATDRLGGRYANEKVSKLTATVTPGKNELPPFNLD